MTIEKNIVPQSPDLLSLYGITRETQILYDVLIDKGELSYELMKNAGLSFCDITVLLRDEIIQKDPEIDRRYHLKGKNNLSTYKNMVKSNPAITSSTFIKEHLPHLVALYGILMAGEPLTNRSLKNAHIDSSTIKEFIKRDIIKEIGPDEYQFLDFERLIVYGNYLYSIGYTDKAIKCYDTCRQLDKDSNLFRPIFLSILLSKYSRALYLLTRFNVPFQSGYKCDYNFYLYILSFIINLPSEENRYVRTLKLEDLLSEDEKNPILNRVRELLYKKKFRAAIELISSTNAKEGSISSELAAIKKISETILDDQNKWKLRIIESIKSKDICSLTNLLRNENKKRKLESPFNYFYAISKDIIQIRKTNRAIPFPKDCSTKNLQGFIKAKDYIKAYCQSVIEGVDNDIPDEKNYMQMLLLIIVKEQALHKTPLDSMEKTIGFYLSYDKRVVLKLLKTYLMLKNREAYLPVLQKLIKLCMLTGDEEYRLFNRILIQIVGWHYIFPYQAYLDAAKLALESGSIELGNLYIEIIYEMLRVQPNENILQELIDIKTSLDGKEEDSKPLTIKPIDEA